MTRNTRPEATGRAGRLVCAALLVSSSSLALACCTKEERGGATSGELSGVASAMEWPGRSAPAAEDLLSYARGDGGRADATVVVGRANACAWYSAWRADFVDDGLVSPSILDHLEHQIPELDFVRNVSGAADVFGHMADQAASGDVAPIEVFLSLNRCAELDQWDVPG